MSAPLGIAALMAIVVIVYHNALAASFFDDDFQWLVGSWSFHPAQLVAFAGMSHFYRPVIDVYFAVMTPLLGGSPVLFHAASIALHVAVVLTVFALATRIAGDPLYGFLAALFFAVQPSDIDAIAWVGALAEAIGALFGCLSLFWFLRWREDGRTGDRVRSVCAFTLAVLTHESSVMFVPMLVLADGLLASGDGGTHTRRFRRFVPYVAVTILYLGIDLWINSRNYVVSQGHYTFGLHIVTNGLAYVDALYVGRLDMVNYVVIAIVFLALLLGGNARVRFATLWIVLALAPFLAFNWGNTSRYLYQPAIGFSMLLAEGVVFLDGRMNARAPDVARIAAIAAITAAIAIRFALFATANVGDFTIRSQTYPAYLARFREIHGAIPGGTLVPPDPRLDVKMPYQFVNAAVEWEYRDPTIRLTPYE